MDKKIVLEVKNLCKSFGGLKAVDDVSFKLYEKEIIAIVGDNGAGKSTLIKLISGLYQKDSGEIIINGEKAIISKPIDSRKYGIETLYQDQGIISEFNAPINLFLGREKLVSNKLGRFFKIMDSKYMEKETRNMLKNIGVEPKNLNEPVYNLSGGQKQSVAVGRAIYWGGRVIIFDEPTNNLGVIQERKVIDLIKKIREEYNISVIIISHNIAHVFELVDRIIVLRNGEKVGDEIKTQTDTNEIVSLITGANTVPSC
ncbi:MAG: ATP-binding cassette domain-containing protein [Candidatus Humimicrobiaceae bacterium]